MIEIERKFLVTSLPEGLQRERLIQQGYLAYDDQMEVRIRKYGDQHFMAVKEGVGLVRRELEIEISAEQFSQLWPATEGRRLEKVRAELSLEGQRIELDRYLGTLEPLLVAEIEFRSIEESERFRIPAFFAQEVTEEEAYRNLSLAVHGLPDQATLKCQIAAMPYLYRRGQLHLVIVTNSAQSRWIIPKGHPEQDMTPQEVAVMEAMEEAGVIGNCTRGLRAVCNLKGDTALQVYPLKVTTLLKKWPEMEWRTRQVLPATKALKLISDPELADCIQRLITRLGG